MPSQPFLTAALAIMTVAPYPAPLLGQEPVRGEMRLRGPERAMQFVMSRRARLGLKVNLRARDTDTIGAYVDAVTPNGPAAKAGIRSGDVITKLDGRSVLDGTRPEPDRDQESLPGLRLIELAAELAPNDTVPVELRRGKETKTVTVVTSDEPTMVFRGRRMAPSLDDTEFEGRFGGAAMVLYGSPLADLELAPLNPDLGQYFGSTSGVLVISAPKDSDLGLKGGDVVLAVDGRKPEGPSHLLRILRSYQERESFKLDVLRNRKRETVTGRLGEASDSQ
jgi:S1-C subfamily serine protease